MIGRIIFVIFRAIIGIFEFIGNLIMFRRHKIDSIGDVNDRLKDLEDSLNDKRK